MGLLALAVTVKPLADVVRDYICSDSYEEAVEQRTHVAHLLPVARVEKGSEARAVFCFFKPLQRGLEKAANTTREPAAETGRSCWGRGQQDMRPAQGPK